MCVSVCTCARVVCVCTYVYMYVLQRDNPPWQEIPARYALRRYILYVFTKSILRYTTSILENAIAKYMYMHECEEPPPNVLISVLREVNLT